MDDNGGSILRSPPPLFIANISLFIVVVFTEAYFGMLVECVDCGFCGRLYPIFYVFYFQIFCGYRSLFQFKVRFLKSSSRTYVMYCESLL